MFVSLVAQLEQINPTTSADMNAVKHFRRFSRWMLLYICCKSQTCSRNSQSPYGTCGFILISDFLWQHGEGADLTADSIPGVITYGWRKCESRDREGRSECTSGASLGLLQVSLFNNLSGESAAREAISQPLSHFLLFCNIAHIC